MAAYVEAACTIEHEGHTFEAGGAYIAPDYLIGYPGPNGILQNWHGQKIGTWIATSSWPIHSWQGSRMYAIRCTVQGAHYYGRGFGEGMILRARRVKAEMAA